MHEWPEVCILLLLVVGAYFLRANDVSMRAEEPRWAQVAFEAEQRGDWVVPREQGEPFFSRPPLHSWLIAGSTHLFGTRAAWAVRLPTLLGTLLTALLIYGYSRTCLGRVGALAAAASFVTLGEMFSTGFQAETEGVFIPLVGAALLLWHWGQVRGWPATATWVASYVCVGLAVLAKGPQPPVYFLGSVTVYLWWTGQWRGLFTRAHLAGVLVGAAIVLAWVLPCAGRVGWPAVWGIFGGDTATRFRDWKLGEVASHLLQYPLEVLGSTLPWSLLLFFYLRRDFRRSVLGAGPQVLFAAVCLAVAFPTCWIPPGGQTRYFAPLYPCLAVLIGVVVQRCSESDALPTVRRAWRRFLSLAGCVMIAAAAGVVFASLFLAHHPRLSHWSEPLPLALSYAAIVGVLAALALRGRTGGNAARVQSAVLALAWFMAITFSGILTDVRVCNSEDQATAVARLKERLPAGTRLVSYGHTDALFAYHYGEPIEARPFPTRAADAPEDGVFFCYHRFGRGPLVLPFPWQEVETISMERDRRRPPDRDIVIGRAVRASVSGPAQ
jgi:4-amino-4-deoxy-L-arabinose transferase-like glycosyltransferase